jgi:hypothetical protein
MSQAFEVQCEFAKRMRVSPYKSKKRFADALRKAAFTVEKVTYGMTEEEWRESAEPDMPVKAVEELTSVRAVEELFEQKIEQRRKRDRTRKAAGRTLVAATAAKENFKKTHGNFQARNAEQRAKKTERQRK